MQTYISFLRNEIMVICGSVDKNTLKVDKIIPYQFKNNCIMNGNITDTENFINEISQFWQDHQLPTKQIFLSLDGNHVKIKKVHTPQKAKISEKYQIIRRSFLEGFNSEISEGEKPVVSFVEVGDNKTDYYGFAIENDYLDNILSIFKRANITITKVVHNRQGLFKLVNYIPQISKANCVVASLDNKVLTLLVIEKGVLVNVSSSRLFSERGTESFGVEVSRNISQLIQFQISTRTENPAKQGYFVGFTNVDLDAVNQHTQELSIEVVPLVESELIKLKGGASLAFFEYIGVLALNKKEESFLSDSNKINKTDRKYSLVLTRVMPVVLFFAMCVSLSAFFVNRTNTMQKELNQINEYLLDESNIEKQEMYNQYLRLLAEENTKITVSESFWQAIESYPLAITKLGTVIESCGADIVSSEIVSFTAETGRLTFTAVGTQASKVNGFVEALEATGLFFNIMYSGYTLDVGGNYTVDIECVLDASVGK